MDESIRPDALRIWRAGVNSVEGRARVRCALSSFEGGIAGHAVAIGKAAVPMMQGAVDELGDRLVSGLVIAPADDATGDGPWPGAIVRLDGDHPVPGENSVHAGRDLVRFLSDLPRDARVLFLVSGGSSSLVEWPVSGFDLAELQSITRWLLGSGLAIRDINAVRCRLSRLKGGGLLNWLDQRPATALYLSDVPGDDPAVIGSGLLAPAAASRLPPELPSWLARRLPERPASPGRGDHVSHRVIGNLDMALEAAAGEAVALGHGARVHTRFLDGEAASEGRSLARFLRDAPEGVHLWGGEPGVILPDRPGRGGRCQQLALAAALALRDNRECGLLAAGTDGIDGASADAGAIVDGGTAHRGETEGLDGSHALSAADAGRFLEAAGDLVSTGPTGTNVRDLVIGWRLPR